jgi:signal transduction histidine kinase
LRFDTTDPRRQGRYAELVRFWAAGLLLFAVIVTLLGPVEPDAGVIIVAAFAILVAAGILIAPWAIGRWRDAMQTRADAIREQHRAEVAAHLHDSVLQSLALIQNRAGASTEIARIARAQERELRDWLYTGSAAVDNDLATELREIASDLELEYAVAFDVVTAGDSAELVSSELVAAAKEAMVNAARHAGGEVSVYLEASDRRVDVWVRDRGPGFDPTAVPTSRLGVRESIVGRMARAGGSATVGPGSGGAGTQVHLQLERTGAPR